METKPRLIVLCITQGEYAIKVKTDDFKEGGKWDFAIPLYVKSESYFAQTTASSSSSSSSSVSISAAPSPRKAKWISACTFGSLNGTEDRILSMGSNLRGYAFEFPDSLWKEFPDVLYPEGEGEGEGNDISDCDACEMISDRIGRMVTRKRKPNETVSPYCYGSVISTSIRDGGREGERSGSFRTRPSPKGLFDYFSIRPERTETSAAATKDSRTNDGRMAPKNDAETISARDASTGRCSNAEDISRTSS